jgi:glycerol-3-phosphate O-acyltransferase / dihydroxyacetone phosphate acyltransferase
VLRARAEAARALAAFFDQLDKLPEEARVRASTHLARSFGGWVEDDIGKGQADSSVGGGVEDEPRGWRSAKEVVSYLRLKGAKIATLKRGIEGGWAALASDTEGTPTEENGGNPENEDDAIWVHRTQSFTEVK